LGGPYAHLSALFMGRRSDAIIGAAARRN